MTPSPRPSLLTRLAAQEDLNFLLTNRISHDALTRLVGRLGKIENPVVRDLSIGLWRAFADLDLADARTTQFRSMHDCFSGETYNVNPAALKRVEKLFCRNERAVLRCRLEASGQAIALVPVAAVLVPRGFTLCDGLRDGARIRVGQAILTMR